MKYSKETIIKGKDFLDQYGISSHELSLLALLHKNHQTFREVKFLFQRGGIGRNISSPRLSALLRELVHKELLRRVTPLNTCGEKRFIITSLGCYVLENEIQALKHAIRKGKETQCIIPKS